MDRQIDVLIADDQLKTRRGLRALLRFDAFINLIWEARDGETAMKIVSEVKPDLVIMDVQMPVLDGIEATRGIKKSWPGVKVVVFSMYPYYKQEALAAGADYFLVKGEKKHSIQEVIHSLFPIETTSLDLHTDK